MNAYAIDYNIPNSILVDIVSIYCDKVKKEMVYLESSNMELFNLLKSFEAIDGVGSKISQICTRERFI